MNFHLQPVTGLGISRSHARTSPARLRPAISRCLGTALLCLLIAACISRTGPLEPELPPDASQSEVFDLVRQARDSSGQRAVTLYIEAAERFLARSMVTDASDTLALVTDIDNQDANVQLRYAMIQARLALSLEDYAAAERWLTGTLTEQVNRSSIAGAEYSFLLGEVYQQQKRHVQALRAYAEITASQVYAENNDVLERIWQSLQQAEDIALQNLAYSAESYELRGWIELQRMLRDSELSIRSQLDAIARWQRTWSRHSAARRLPPTLTRLQFAGNSMPEHLVLILPIRQQSGLPIQEGFFSAYFQTLESTSEVPRITIIDSSFASDVSGIYQQAVAAGADLIIGPLDKNLVNQLGSRESLPVPTLALNYLDSGQLPPENLYQFGLAPEDEIAQLAELAWQAGHRNAAVLTPVSQGYLQLGDEFSDRWQQRGGQVVTRASFADTTDYSDTVRRLLAIDSSEARAARILDLLPRNSIEFIPRRRQDIDCIFLIANPGQGRLIKPTLAFFFAEDVPVYAMPSIYDGRVNALEDRDLDDIWFTDAPWLLQESDPFREQVTASLRQASGPQRRLRALGIDSFRLYARLQLLSEGSIKQISGATGELTMADDRSIHRRLQVARFIYGEARELSPPQL